MPVMSKTDQLTDRFQRLINELNDSGLTKAQKYACHKSFSEQCLNDAALTVKHSDFIGMKSVDHRFCVILVVEAKDCNKLFHLVYYDDQHYSFETTSL